MQSVSVIITNYNYKMFVGDAISSALALRGICAEVIVVDDGSTDGSMSVIDGFGNAIQKVYQSNKSQTAACNAGFALSKGEIIVFLDADDRLHPDLAKRLSDVWNERVSKVQYQLQRIDQSGKPRGSAFPIFDPIPTAAQIRRWCLTTSAYPTPPGSGNAYSRWFLEQIFPLDPNVDSAADSFCLAAAPLLGDVITIAEPLADYRIHDRNDSRATPFSAHLTRALKRYDYQRAIAQKIGLVLPNALPFRSLETLQFRAASLRINLDQHSIPNDRRWKAALDTLRVLPYYKQVALRRRILLVCWTLAVLALPKPLALKAIERRYNR